MVTLRGMDSTLRMRTAISPGQWQPWTGVPKTRVRGAGRGVRTGVKNTEKN